MVFLCSVCFSVRCLDLTSFLEFVKRFVTSYFREYRTMKHKGNTAGVEKH